MYLRPILVLEVLETTGLTGCVSHEKQLTSERFSQLLGLLLPPKSTAQM